ncbi:putative Gnk2-like domain-containing protein [Helianthus debilis subsp. tardiflorus]
MEIKSVVSFLFILQTIINGVDPTIGQSSKTDKHVCRGGESKGVNIIMNKASALDKVLGLLDNSSNFHGFYHVQVGDKPEEQVSASLLCPPHVHKGQCVCCLDGLLKYLLDNCGNQQEGVAWDAYFSFYCMLRFTTGRKILSVLDNWAWYDLVYDNYVKAVDLVKTMDSLTSTLKEQAAGGNDLDKFASGKVIYDGDEHKLYAVAQCTPDLSKADCVKCLSEASTRMRSCCTGKSRFDGRVFSANCILRYSHIKFITPPEEYDPKYCA